MASTEELVLAVISEIEPMSRKEIQDKFSLTKRSISFHLNSLLSKGRIKRIKCFASNDMRRVFYIKTPNASLEAKLMPYVSLINKEDERSG